MASRGHNRRGRPPPGRDAHVAPPRLSALISDSRNLLATFSCHSERKLLRLSRSPERSRRKNPGSFFASLLSVIPSVAEGPRLPGSPYSDAGANSNPEWSKAPDC
jgi:hypothetical protein